MWERNVVAYIAEFAIHNGYGGEIGTPGTPPYALPGHEARHTGNMDILDSDGDYSKPVCAGTGMSILGNNSVYSPTGAITECGVTLKAWQVRVRGRVLCARGSEMCCCCFPCMHMRQETIWGRQRSPTPRRVTSSHGRRQR